LSLPKTAFLLQMTTKHILTGEGGCHLGWP